MTENDNKKCNPFFQKILGIAKKRKSKRQNSDSRVNTKNENWSQEIHEIPASVLITNILPLLDHKTWNQFITLNKEIYLASRILTPPWPEGDLRVGKLVTSVAFSPDNETLAVTSCRKKIQIWDRKRGHYTSLEGHLKHVLYVCFSPNGNLLASSSKDGTVRMYSIEPPCHSHIIADQFRCIRIFEGHEAGIPYLAFSRDGSSIVTRGYDSTIRLWDVAEGACRQVFEVPVDLESYECVAFSPCGKTLAIVIEKEMILLWNLLYGTYARLIQPNHITAITYTPTGDSLVVATRDGTARFWDISNHSCVRIIEVGSPQSLVNSIVFSPDGTKMFAGNGSKIQVLNMNDGSFAATLRGHKDRVESLSVSPDGHTLVSGGDSKIHFWNII
jgi:WD40 repeat protein